MMVAVDYELVSEGIRSILSRDPLFQVTVSAESPLRILALIEELQPPVLILQDTLRGGDTFRLCAIVSQRRSVTRVIVLSGRPTDVSTDRALRSGALGILTMRASAAEIRRMVRDVACGHAALDPRVVRHVLDSVRRQTGTGVLSKREAQVMNMIQAGVTDRTMADQLGLSLSTVKTYVRRALDKLACERRCEASARLARSETSWPE